MQPLVSVVIPVYNIEKYIEECIKSVLSQSYTNLEVFLVDDGSRDKGGEICDRYAQEDSRIKVIHKANAGVSAARNDGIEYSAGEYIAFVDGDDWLERNYIEKLVNRAVLVDSDICLCGCYIEHEKFSERNDFCKENIELCDEKQKMEFRSQLICRGISSYYPPRMNVGVPWGKIYKKSFLIKNSLEFKIGVKRMQDNLFNLFAFKCAERFSYVNEPLYHYRNNDSSVCHKLNPDIVEDFKPFLKELLTFVKNEQPCGEKWIAGAHKRVLTSFSSYMSSYFFNKNNGESISEKRRAMLSLLGSPMTREAIANVDWKMLDAQEFLLVLCIKYKLFWGLYILNKGKQFISGKTSK